MKMWKEKTWQHEITGVDGNVILFGVNVFEYKWVFTGNTVVIKDRAVNIYSVKIDDTEHLFGAIETSNCVWDFYLFKY